jgi:putative ABC transport system ATP-binding protein
LNGTANAPLITLSGVSKDYVGGGGVVHALRDVDITIRYGEFVAIVGQSGSGKSTLMNILGCLDRPTHGTHTLSEIEVGARSNDARAIVRNRLIGFIFQGFNLLPRTTALENVELPLQYRGVPVRERRARAREALAAVSLADRMHHTPSQLSGGQQQRVAIARALVSDPPLLLADEPTGNLDTRTSLEVLALLQRLNRERGITVCIVTHEQDIAACAKRVMSFRDGRMVSDVEQENPLDAAAALAALPPPEPQEAEAADVAPEAHAHGMKSPVPVLVYFAMVAGLLLGLSAGTAYTTAVLGQRVVWIPVICGLLLEAWLGARVGRARQGRPLASYQRLRVALNYTLAVGVVQAAVVAFVPIAGLERFTGSRGSLVFAVTTVLWLAAFGLLRYLLLSLFSSASARPRRPVRA